MTFTLPKAVLLIRNPIAGRRRRGLVDAVMRQVRAEGWTVDLVDTEAAGDARRLAETCDATKYGVIAVAGGDGTINEVVNGLAGRGEGAPALAPALAIVPLGTANVLAHELGLGFEAAPIAHTMVSGRALLLRPGEACNGGAPRCFSLMARTAFDAKAVAGVGRPVALPVDPGAACLCPSTETPRYTC